MKYILYISSMDAQGSEQTALAFRSALPGAGDGLIDFQRSLPA